MPILLNKNESVVVLGEAMIELSGITENSASIGVAGDTFNTAVYLARQDVDVQYVTALGVDQFSDRIRRALTAEHIGTDWIRTIPERIPGLYAISVDDEGERSFDYWRRKSAARKLFEAEGIEEVLTSISSTGLLYISGITLSIMRDRIYELTALAERVRENGGHVVFDTNYNCRFIFKFHSEFLARSKFKITWVEQARCDHRVQILLVQIRALKWHQ